MFDIKIGKKYIFQIGKESLPHGYDKFLGSLVTVRRREGTYYTCYIKESPMELVLAEDELSLKIDNRWVVENDE